MSELVSRFVTFFDRKVPSRIKCLSTGLFLFIVVAGFAHGQDSRKVTISFVPPPLENATYSLGIYEAKSGKLVRRLQEIAPESAFTVGLNGLITSWDGKDDNGKPVPVGRYAARGYAVGALKVEGIDILGNDWASDNAEMRISAVQGMVFVPADNGLIIAGLTPDDRMLIARYGGPESKLLWRRKTPVAASKSTVPLFLTGETLIVSTAGSDLAYRLSDGGDATLPHGGFYGQGTAGDSSSGKDGTGWKIEEGVLTQYSPQGERLRNLVPKEGDPVPVAVVASKDTDRLYLLESTKKWQRVRGLSWVETKEEDGKQVSTWKTFFERNIRRSEFPNLGVATEMDLIENPLAPGKPQKVVFESLVDATGSYLAASGLRLRQVSERAFLQAAKLERSKSAGRIAFFQTDGAVWDEFSIEGAKNMMEFDAGEFEMTADGEKTHAEKPVEPPDL